MPLRAVIGGGDAWHAANTVAVVATRRAVDLAQPAPITQLMEDEGLTCQQCTTLMFVLVFQLMQRLSGQRLCDRGVKQVFSFNPTFFGSCLGLARETLIASATMSTTAARSRIRLQPT